MKTLEELLQLFPNNQTILDAAIKLEDHIATGERFLVSVSGGSDSDIVADMVERIGYAPGQAVYVFFDTGLEYEATKRHLVFLEEKYGIQIHRHRAKKAIPTCARELGVPFHSKRVSMYIKRLQRHGFQWEDEPLDVLKERYPNCLAALKWWCNGWGEGSGFNIARDAGMKEFLLRNPPPTVSDECCTYAKKNAAYELEGVFDVSLSIVGVRRAENGIRSKAYTSCYTAGGRHAAQFRPIFYFTDKDKQEYEEFCGVVHSDCYSVYGLKRTGCACCPFSSNFEHELEVVQQHEPKLYQAANAIFGAAYDYTRAYRAFKEPFKREKRRGGQIDLFDRWDDPAESCCHIVHFHTCGTSKS